MTLIPPSSQDAVDAIRGLEALQKRFASGLEQLDRGQPFERVEWKRDDGRHGGGNRLVAKNGRSAIGFFNTASVNISAVHYDDNPKKKLSSASALSAIVHPSDPNSPSMHIHVSWTELRNGTSYWRIMADLNPAIPNDSDVAFLKEAMKSAAPAHFDTAQKQGDLYFYIPALKRYRGIFHYYLEGFFTEDKSADSAVAFKLGETAIDSYLAILNRKLLQNSLAKQAPPPSKSKESEIDAKQRQLAYHTLYFFQVLTLDRGTTSGLLVHDQNDVGILGSLPTRIDRDLLSSWAALAPKPQDELVRKLLKILPEDSFPAIDAECKRKLAAAVRAHYAAFPQALALQASGAVIPTTVDNHGEKA